MVRRSIALVLLLALPSVVHAGDQTVLGTQISAKDPSSADKRKVIVQAEEAASDDTIVGDPTASGATLTVSLYGSTPTVQTFALAAQFWSGDVVKGFTYRDPAGASSPVKTVKMRKAPDGTLRIKATISGKLGAVALAPPNAGTTACAMLTLAGGDSYSVRFGDGAVTNRGAKLFKVKAPATEGTCVTCGNGFEDPGESCDPNGSPCSAGGVCQPDCTCLYTAPNRPVLAFDETEAAAANGSYPSADPLPVCGANDRRFLGELVDGSPLDYKVPLRLADVKASPSEMMVSGVAHSVSLGDGDFPFDHTFGSDLNMDIALDAPYGAAAQNRGIVGGDLHVELSEGQLPHQEGAPGPAAGEEWQTMSDLSRQGIHTRFIPDNGSRVAIMGHWVIDCGHTSFQTELHPITFMANARVTGTTTVVDAFYNPYRERQGYHFEEDKALAFDDPLRLMSGSGPFPLMLILNVLRLQDLGPAPYQSIDHLESWAMLEPNRTSPGTWRVCAPSGSTGTRLDIRYHWITRPGVQVDVTPDLADGCALISLQVDNASIAAPTPRVCVTPWDWLDTVAGAEAGVPDLDLQATLAAYIPPPYQPRLEPDPILNCYDPIAGPAPQSPPTGQTLEVRSDVLLPFYGTISVQLVSD